MVLPRFVRNLLLSRQRAELPLLLSRKRIYILPTRAGLVFGFFLLSMLVAAINYTNNLAFLLTFLLGSIAVISSIHAYANLAGLELAHARLFPAFCGEDARLHFGLRAGGRERRRVRVQVGDAADEFSLPASDRCELELVIPTTKRGRVPLGQVVISTRFPLGLFRAWSPLVLPVTGLAYPRPLPVEPRDWMLQIGDGAEEGMGRIAQSGEFFGLRPFRPEDDSSRISWKASARGAGLFAKEFRTHLARSFDFEWSRVGGVYEERISLLAGLVREAERNGLCYGLQLPTQVVPRGSGAGHAHRCLEALALMPDAS